MGSDSKKPHAACVEDCDEEDKAVRGTRRSASTKSKTKGERESRSSRDKHSHRDSGYSSQAVTTGSEKSLSPKSTRVEVVKEEIAVDRESRRKSTSGTSTRSPRKSSSRPPLTRNNVTSPPQLEIPFRPRADPSYYGVSPNSTYTPNSSVRSRPQSYYGGMPLSAVSMPVPTAPIAVSRPPVSRSGYYNSPSPAMGGASYPMASPAESYMRYAPAQSDYFTNESPRANTHLAERFNRPDPISRTTSAQGFRTIGDSYLNQPSFEQETVRNSIRRRAKEAEDLRRMPPPPSRRTSVIDSRIMTGPYPYEAYSDGSAYEQRSTGPAYSEPVPAHRSSHRPSSNRSSTYELGQDVAPYRTETSNHRRRSSYYEGQSPSNYEDKVREATGYQEEVAGGPPVSLTAEALRKQQRTTASSRSTRSSGSHDESDFKRSATTRTTTSRIEGDGEDVTIRFKGGATVNIMGAEIKCDDGAEVNIIRQKSIRNGSERSASEYGTVQTDDRRSRDSRRPGYSRSTSKSGHSNPLPLASRYRPGYI